MHLFKTAKSKKISFTDNQIRAKAHQISQKHGDHSLEKYWYSAIQELEIESQWRMKFWRLTGFGEKKLWDVLALLIVPIVLAVAGVSLQDFAKQREQLAATEKANQDTLVKYQDQMADLLQKGLLTTKTDSVTFSIAQVKTVTALQSLDPIRQHLIIQFLEASKLNISPGKYGILHDAKMTKAKLIKADLSSAKLSDAKLSDADLSGANLSGADLSGADLSGAILSGAILSGANLSGAILSGANLSNVDLSNFDLSNANLSNANLSNANLSNANLSNANLSNAYLSNANLSSVNLSGAFLYKIDLSNINLNKANLKGVKLINVNLKNANLNGAELNGADLSGADPKSAKLCKTTLQDGKISNDDCSKF
jgi:uncharacterized protein YjbI with pentapeptide repeats